MNAATGAQEARGNVRGVRDPEAFHGACTTALAAFTGHEGDAAARRRVWRAMRVLRAFDLPLLGIVAVAPAEIAEQIADELVQAGHLVRDDSGADGDHPRFRLTGDAGPTLPIGSPDHV